MHGNAVEHESTGRIPARLQRTPRRARILLVEDDTDMRALVGTVLRDDGHEVVEADSGVAMLRHMESALWTDGRRERFDVVLADVQMPDLTALEVMEALRYRQIETPIVLMTAYGTPRSQSDSAALGAFALLEKPLDWGKLRAAIRDAMEPA
jgi:DNA-binding NtrC family response regulator